MRDEVIKGNILIVDDKPENLRLLSNFLTERGYKVRSVINGPMALMGAKAAPPDLILLDINMPEMNGYEVCNALKEDAQTLEIPVIFISALDEVLDKVKAFAVGGRDYITKPFEFEEVVARIENQLTIRNLQKQLQESEARERERAYQLEYALRQLQNSQAQLVQSAKMSSLGQLVAGIAHEINNPANFIHGNVIYTTQYVADLLELLELYQAQLPELTPEIQRRIEAIDLEFLKEDLIRILSSMQVGTERISGIVRSLRNFSRLDEANMKIADLHEGIDNTLMLLENRLQAQSGCAAIRVVKEYGDLPQVECYPGQLNQVFMNILSNAIDALQSNPGEEREQGNLPNSMPSSVTPTIWICTEVLNSDWISIRITDNGPGMSEEVQSKVFDPFFTTKPVGKGTGLGLSISYQIIQEQHGGLLQCFSQLGQGASFVVKIPLRQP
ncbi:MAG TPA: hybrid sensor histidine kinase/response regulator [Cyanobacteria bacterium UBA8803]|nr:hybrid sensor histidine kinase/response regulator [Cyanobacteria bacterium UBA9273]HBL59747.1 hybrid sensor histidine kinase/response regulator [Cyanobacteria bacterium UBA8803]